MKYIIIPGFCFTNERLFPTSDEITIRTETTRNFTTISFAQDDKGILLQVPLTKELKELLKGVIE